MIFPIPIQDSRLKLSGIKFAHILPISMKFHRDLSLNSGARSIPIYLSFRDFEKLRDFKGFLFYLFYHV